MPLSPESTKKLQQTVEAACANPTNDIPGLSVVVVDKDGKELFAHAAGKRGVSSSEPMGLGNVFWIASCTKMVAGIACMQLVEQGKLHLDDGDELERLCPELKSIKVLQKDGTLVEKNKKITLRMLLTHTGMLSLISWSFRMLTPVSWLRLHLLQRQTPRLLGAHWVRRILRAHQRHDAAVGPPAGRRMGIRGKH